MVPRERLESLNERRFNRAPKIGVCNRKQEVNLPCPPVWLVFSTQKGVGDIDAEGEFDKISSCP
jgi:hypothetical protein